jgi:hypothetical protein
MTYIDEILLLAATCARLHRLIPERDRPWSLEQIAWSEGLDETKGAAAIVEAVRATVGDSPTPSQRIDQTLRFLGLHGLTPPGGWTSDALAAMAGCSGQAIRQREAVAIDSARAAFRRQGITRRRQLLST